MSEVPTESIEDIPPAEQLVGADTLWRDDPLARVAYSGSPSNHDPNYLETARMPHPIHRVNDSILARPEIAEALEQIQLSRDLVEGRTGEQNGSAPAAVDAELALD